MRIFRRLAVEQGLPRSLYPDRHSIYRRSDQKADEMAHRTGERPLTRFGEAMSELVVSLICARSPQVKGRVERANATLQDRLVKLLKLEGITAIDAHRYLEQTYLPSHNARFAVAGADPGHAHGPSPSEPELDAALCPVRERRVVHKASGACGGGRVSWLGRCFELTGSDATPRRRREVTVRQRLDDQVELLAVSDGRVLASRERAEPPLPERTTSRRRPSVSPSIAPRASRRWTPVARAGRGARLRCGSLRSPPLRRAPRPQEEDTSTRSRKGTLLLRLQQPRLARLCGVAGGVSFHGLVRGRLRRAAE